MCGRAGVVKTGVGRYFHFWLNALSLKFSPNFFPPRGPKLDKYKVKVINVHHFKIGNRPIGEEKSGFNLNNSKNENNRSRDIQKCFAQRVYHHHSMIFRSETKFSRRLALKMLPCVSGILDEYNLAMVIWF